MIYANGIPIFLFATGMLGLIVSYSMYQRASGRKVILALGLGTLMILPITYVLLRDSYPTLVEMIVKNAAGAPYDLGVSRLNDLLPVIGGRLEFANYFAEGKAFRPLENNFADARIRFFFVFGLIAVGVMANLQSWQQTIKTLLLVSIPLVTTLLAIKALNPARFQAYLYARHQVNFITLGLPLLLGLLISSKALGVLWGRVHRSTQISLFVVISGIALFNFFKMTRHFADYSRELNIVKSVDDYKGIQPANTIFVTKKPDQRVTSLALLGEVYYLTDDWSPQLSTQTKGPKVRDVVLIDLDSQPLSFKKIGHLTIDRKITGPLSVDQILRHPSFSTLESGSGVP